MQLVVQPVTIKDFDILETYGSSPQGDLISPILDGSWKVSSPAEKVARNTWGTAQQREIFLKDPTAIFLKVADKESNEIISLARWHHYPEGFRYPEHARLEFDAFTQSEDDASWPGEINAALYRGLTSSCFSTRQKWQKPGPSWVCTTLMTRTGYRRCGAGRLLVEWGLAKAAEEGVPAYIEGSPEGTPLYEKCGFRIVDETPVEGKAVGLDQDFSITNLAWYPPSTST